MMKQHKRVFLDFAYAAVILVTAFALNLALLQWFRIPSVTPMIFVLGVFLIAWRTQGYFWGIVSSLASVMAVNYAFTYPYWAFNLIRPECLASAVVMLMVSIMTSTMTTQIKRQEQMKAEAEKERMRGNLLRAVSHDLRTPLTRLRLRTELVADEALREQMTRDLETMAAMLDATLDYLRGVQMSEAPCRIDMNALLQSLTDDARVLGHEIAITGLAQAPYTGRLSALRRALQNLLDNAIQHGQHAHILVEESPEALCITVEDEGPGIPPDQLTRVTEPYYRVDAARGAETGGVGLGLAIVQDVALLHGGELVLRNRTGGGLAARLVLPRQASA